MCHLSQEVLLIQEMSKEGILLPLFSVEVTEIDDG